MAAFQIVPRAQLIESPLQTRRHYDKNKLQELAESITSKGILTPLLVRPAANGYEIGAGHRRYRAAGMVGIQELPVLVRDMDDAAFLELITIENLQREDIHPLDEALAYKTLLGQSSFDVKVLAAKIGKSTSYVYQRLKLADLIPAAHQVFLDGKITVSHALLLARLQPEDQESALASCLEECEWRGADGVKSVTELAKWIDRHVTLDLERAPFNLTDASLCPAAGACTTCPKRSSAQAELWGADEDLDACMDKRCFEAKVDAHIERSLARWRAVGQEPLRLSDRYHDPHPRPADAPLLKSRWVSITDDTCDFQQHGLIVEGNNRGQMLAICAEAGCAVHSVWCLSAEDEEYKSARQREAKQARIDLAVRRNLFQHVRERVGGILEGRVNTCVLALPRAAVELALGALWRRSGSDTQCTVAKLYGWVSDTKHDLGDYGAEQIAAMDVEALSVFLVDLALAPSQCTNPYESSRKLLSAFASLYEVDVKSIERQVKTSAKPTKKPALQLKKPGIPRPKAPARVMHEDSYVPNDAA